MLSDGVSNPARVPGSIATTARYLHIWHILQWSLHIAAGSRGRVRDRSAPTLAQATHGKWIVAPCASRAGSSTALQTCESYGKASFVAKATLLASTPDASSSR